MFARCIFVGMLCVLVHAAQASETGHSSLAYTDGAVNDRVTELPGALSELKSNQFSGYLNITNTKALHYMYFESENDPTKDNVIFWTNGGPGII